MPLVTDYHRKATFPTERAVTRSQTAGDRAPAAKKEDMPAPILWLPAQREPVQPMCGIVLQEVERKFPTLTRKQARRRVRRMIREASEEEKAKWRLLGMLPPKPKKSLTWGVAHIKLITPRKTD